MGIFDFVSKWIGFSQNSGGIGEYTHKRYHARYLINDRDLCTIDHDKCGLFRVIDVSHHGCLVEGVADSSFDSCALPFLVDFSLCGAKVRLEVSQCQRRKNGWALVFRHAHETSIRSISGFIEPIRWGSSAIAMNNDRENDGVMAKFRRRFQGDGPFDLMFEKDEKGQVVFLMATVRRGIEYGCVIWDKGNVSTKKSVDQKGVGARMAQTQEVDRDLVWTCAASCIGMKFVEGAQCAKALNEWLSASDRRVPYSKSV